MRKMQYRTIMGFAVMLASGLFYACGNVCAADIVLHDSRVTSEENVCLRNIATITGFDVRQDVLVAMNNMIVCKAPRPGYKREINRAYVVMKLKQYNFDLSNMKFIGSEYATIQRAERQISVDEQQVYLKHWLTQELGLDASEFMVVCKNTLRDFSVSDGDITVKCVGEKKTFYQRSAGVVMEFYVDGVFEVRKTVNFSLQIAKDVVVTAKTIVKGDVVVASDVKMKKMFVASYDNDYCGDLELVVGSVAKKDIYEDTYVSKRDIVAVKAVTRGSAVACVIQDKNLAMVVTLYAAEDGYQGDVIRLINQSTNKTLQGLVVGAGKVELLA